jgi:hypothetical protein
VELIAARKYLQGARLPMVQVGQVSRSIRSGVEGVAPCKWRRGLESAAMTAFFLLTGNFDSLFIP